MKISVIICSHNPREDYLQRTLEGLNKQTLAKNEWELLLVDNASEEPLSATVDLSWHPHGKHIKEEELGLTPARLCGMHAAESELLVFVDDDNILNPDYLEHAVNLAENYPRIGAFGGSSIGEFESEPAEDIQCMIKFMAIQTVAETTWARLPGTKALHAAPVGAGMVVRKSVAMNYAQKVNSDPLRRQLDRVGTKFSSCGDTDMVFCSYEEGFGIGLFPELVLTHLIPRGRLEKEYLLKLAEGIAYSFTILTYLWDRKLPAAPAARSERLLNAYQTIRARMRNGANDSFAQRVNNVRRKAVLEARQHLLDMKDN